MIKCIATDMDGTLLNTMQQVSAENREAILQAQAKGIEVVVATGRSYQEAVYALADAGISCPAICANGAEVRSKDGEIISATPIPKTLAREVAAKLNKIGVYYEVYTNEGAYTIDADKAVSIMIDIVTSANPEVKPEDVAYEAGARVRDGLIRTVEDYEVVFSDGSLQIYKLLVFSFDFDKLEIARESISDLEEITVTKSGDENLEITHKKAQKGIALEAFTAIRGISLAETMAIGDNFNDVSMFERVGKAVAMGNASYEIKALCDEVTDTNENSGVGKAILSVL